MHQSGIIYFVLNTFFILQGYGKKSFKTDLETHKVTLAETVFIIYVW